MKVIRVDDCHLKWQLSTMIDNGMKKKQRQNKALID
jgi:hypothetical protein